MINRLRWWRYGLAMYRRRLRFEDCSDCGGLRVRYIYVSPEHRGGKDDEVTAVVAALCAACAARDDAVPQIDLGSEQRVGVVYVDNLGSEYSVRRQHVRDLRNRRALRLPLSGRGA